MEKINKLKSNIYKMIDKIGLKNKDFTIISNNCWGGFVYQRYDLVYNTPFIGLFIFASDYIKLLKNFKKYIHKELVFINASKSKYIIELKNNNTYNKYPIALLGDVEIHFLHYKDENEAREKWNRRVKRINYDNILIKFSENDLCTPNLIKEFDKVNFDNKICLTANKYDIKSAIQIKEFEKLGIVKNE